MFFGSNKSLTRVSYASRGVLSNSVIFLSPTLLSRGVKLCRTFVRYLFSRFVGNRATFRVYLDNFIYFLIALVCTYPRVPNLFGYDHRNVSGVRICLFLRCNLGSVPH